MMQHHRITIAIVTYKRPASLARTLDSIAKLTWPAGAGVQLLVVDNDAGKSAQAVLESSGVDDALHVTYAVEPKKGIVHARNKALELAADSDYIAFLDDDDTVDAGWLTALYSTARKYNADVVQGYVAYHFDEQNAYLSMLDIFANPRAHTGEALPSAWTNNVLFSTQIYKETGLHFDSAFNKIGGSDSHFFSAAKQQGAHIVMCRRAVVHTVLPAQRTQIKWLARRYMRVGAGITISQKKHKGLVAAVWQVVKSVGDSAKYCWRLFPGLGANRQRWVHPSMVLCFMLGRLSGLFNVAPREYK